MEKKYNDITFVFHSTIEHNKSIQSYVKNSGLGVVNGKEGLLGYAHAMPIIIGKKSASAYPYTDKSFEQLQGALKIFWGNRIVRKIFG